MNITDEQLLQEFMDEIKQLAQQNMIVRLNLTPDQAMALIGAIQLTCRHPGYTGPSRLVIERIAQRMQSEFLQYNVPHIIEVIRRGCLREYDVKKELGDSP